jgi:hypothetical protein
MDSRLHTSSTIRPRIVYARAGTEFRTSRRRRMENFKLKKVRILIFLANKTFDQTTTNRGVHEDIHEWVWRRKGFQQAGVQSAL